MFRPRGVVSVASEAVTILRIILPPMPASQSKAAAAFAAEPLIGQPLEEVQVILGPRLGDEGDGVAWLVVVVARDRLARILAQDAVSGARILPDVLLLPRPDEGQWTIATRGGSVMARLPDGTGFAAPQAAFAAVWAQAARPALVLVHGAVPEGLPIARSMPGPVPDRPEPALAGFDLAEGQTQTWRRPGRLAALAAVLILGLMAHLTVMGVQAQRAAAAAAASEAALRVALTERGVTVGTSLDAAATGALRGGSGAQEGGFLPILGQAMQAMEPQTGVISVQDMSYDAKAGRLTLTLLAPDLVPLQTSETLLNAAGLKADLGPSTVTDGQARATVAITKGAS